MTTRLPEFVRDPTPWSSVMPASCFGDCFAECVADGGMSKSGCRVLCAQECGGVPRDPRPGPAPGPGPSPSPAPGTGGLPIYGNYCGPGFGDVSGDTVPIDAVDSVCRTHDLCYDASGYFNCGCDRGLIAAMPAAIAATPST